MTFEEWWKVAKTNPAMQAFTDEDIAQQAYAAGREAATIPLIDRLVVLHIYRKEHDTDPALALKDILDWEIQTALDPQVSSDAQALIDRGREKAAQKDDGEPVAEIIECEINGQQTVREIDGRWKFLRYGDKLFTRPAHDDTALLRQCLEAFENVAGKGKLCNAAVAALRERLGEKE